MLSEVSAPPSFSNKLNRWVRVRVQVQVPEALLFQPACPVSWVELGAFLTLPVTLSKSWAQERLFPASLCSSWKYNDHKKHKWQNHCKNKRKLNQQLIFRIFQMFYLPNQTSAKPLLPSQLEITAAQEMLHDFKQEICCLPSNIWMTLSDKRARSAFRAWTIQFLSTIVTIFLFK